MTTRLVAVEAPLAVRGTLRPAFDVVNAAARRGLAVRDREQDLAGHQLGQQRFAAGCFTDVREDRCRQHATGRERLQHQVATELLGDQREFDRPEPEPAQVLRHRRREPAHFGERGPGAARKPAALAGQCQPLLEFVVLLEVARRAFLQHALVVGQVEIHGRCLLKVRTSPWR